MVASMHEMNLSQRIVAFAGVMGATVATDAKGETLPSEAIMLRLQQLLASLREADRSLFVIGNGGSASVASHAVVDFLNVGRLRATTIHDSALMTCMANDYGYENAFARILETMARAGDMLVAISSSGRSKNIVNAGQTFARLGGTVVTLSGFAADNLLRSVGHYNLWLNSDDYGFVEIGHQFLLHNLADRLRVGAR